MGTPFYLKMETGFQDETNHHANAARLNKLLLSVAGGSIGLFIAEWIYSSRDLTWLLIGVVALVGWCIFVSINAWLAKISLHTKFIYMTLIKKEEDETEHPDH